MNTFKDETQNYNFVICVSKNPPGQIDEWKWVFLEKVVKGRLKVKNNPFKVRSIFAIQIKKL